MQYLPLKIQEINLFTPLPAAPQVCKKSASLSWALFVQNLD